MDITTAPTPTSAAPTLSAKQKLKQKRAVLQARRQGQPQPETENPKFKRLVELFNVIQAKNSIAKKRDACKKMEEEVKKMARDHKMSKEQVRQEFLVHQPGIDIGFLDAMLANVFSSSSSSSSPFSSSSISQRSSSFGMTKKCPEKKEHVPLNLSNDLVQDPQTKILRPKLAFAS